MAHYVQVYRSSLGDCSNHGISEKADQLIVLGPDEAFQPPARGYSHPVARLVKGNVPGLCKIVPYEAPGEGGKEPARFTDTGAFDGNSGTGGEVKNQDLTQQ